MAKRTKKRCKILSRSAPHRVDYERESTHHRGGGSLYLSEDSSELQPQHAYPPYGGQCWRQAYDEMMAYTALLNAAKLWEYARTATYMPQSVRDSFFAAYEQSKLAYAIAWQVMEDCVTGAVA